MLNPRDWLTWVYEELRKGPVTLALTFCGGLFWFLRREVQIQNLETRLANQTQISETRLEDQKQNSETRLANQTQNSETRIEMLTRLLDMEYHEDYVSWRGE